MVRDGVSVAVGNHLRVHVEGNHHVRVEYIMSALHLPQIGEGRRA